MHVQENDAGTEALHIARSCVNEQIYKDYSLTTRVEQEKEGHKNLNNSICSWKVDAGTSHREWFVVARAVPLLKTCVGDGK